MTDEQIAHQMLSIKHPPSKATSTFFTIIRDAKAVINLKKQESKAQHANRLIKPVLPGGLHGARIEALKAAGMDVRPFLEDTSKIKASPRKGL